MIDGQADVLMVGHVRVIEAKHRADRAPSDLDHITDKNHPANDDLEKRDDRDVVDGVAEAGGLVRRHEFMDGSGRNCA